MLDRTKPLIIKGKPDSRVEIEGSPSQVTGAQPCRVYSNGMSCMIYMTSTGFIPSGLYENEWVINLATHTQDQEELAAMEADTLWGSF